MSDHFFDSLAQKAKEKNNDQVVDRFDALISKAKKGKGEEDERPNKFDALIPLKAKSQSADDNLRETLSNEGFTNDGVSMVDPGSSSHGSTFSKSDGMFGSFQSEKSTMKMKSALSMNATTGGGKGRFDSLRKRDDLGRSLHGRVKFVDDLGHSLGKDSVSGKSILESAGDKPPKRPSMMRAHSETNLSYRSSPFDALIPKSNNHDKGDIYGVNTKTNTFDDLIPKFVTNGDDDLSSSKHGASPKAQPTPEQASLLTIIHEAENLLHANEERHAAITNEIKAIMKRGEAVPRPLRSLRDDLEDEIPVLEESLRTHRQQLNALGTSKSMINTTAIDKFDQMVRGGRTSENDELSNSKHGSVAKALVVDREVRLLGNDDLGSSKHGNVTKDLVIERLDALVCTFYPTLIAHLT